MVKLNKIHKIISSTTLASYHKWCTMVVPEKRDKNEVSLLVALDFHLQAVSDAEMVNTLALAQLSWQKGLINNTGDEMEAAFAQ